MYKGLYAQWTSSLNNSKIDLSFIFVVFPLCKTAIMMPWENASDDYNEGEDACLEQFISVG